ncbi:MAG: hypothetical protein KDK41_12655 [Leptospiraceae bacterium]|nr:hypothetical protein [Leptospiraceae bacterium]
MLQHSAPPFDQIGIWGFWHSLVREYQVSDFAIYYTVGGQVYCITEKGIEASSFKFEELHALKEIKAELATTGFRYLMPVRWHENRAPIVWQFFCANEILSEVVYNWQNWLRYLIAAEALDERKYPTFLPFFHPSRPQDFDMNEALGEPSGLFFLNGQKGTGRFLFVRNHVLLHRKLLIDEQQAIRHARFVPEVALLEPAEQLELLALSEKSSEAVYLASLYDPAMLVGRGILLPELAKVIERSRLIFKAVEPGSNDALKISAFYREFKPEKEYAAEASNIDLLIGGAVSFEQLPGEHLREIVQNIEIRAIQKAIGEVGLSQHKIARRLGISRGSLQHKIKKYNLPYSEWDDHAG